jgi:hypothetical protein
MCRSKFGEEQIISTCASKKRKRRSAKRASATGISDATFYTWRAQSV